MLLLNEGSCKIRCCQFHGIEHRFAVVAFDETPHRFGREFRDDVLGDQIDEFVVQFSVFQPHAQDNNAAGAFEFLIDGLRLTFWHGFSIVYLQQF